MENAGLRNENVAPCTIGNLLTNIRERFVSRSNSAVSDAVRNENCKILKLRYVLILTKNTRRPQTSGPNLESASHVRIRIRMTY